MENKNYKAFALGIKAHSKEQSKLVKCQWEAVS